MQQLTLCHQQLWSN